MGKVNHVTRLMQQKDKAALLINYAKKDMDNVSRERRLTINNTRKTTTSETNI